MRKQVAVFSFCLFLVALLLSANPVCSAIIDLDAPFDSEGDGVIHFGDQTIAHFVDTTTDYNNDRVISKTFTVSEQADSNGSFLISIDHYQSSYNQGYYNYFSVNGHDFGYLTDSSLDGDHDGDNDGSIDWVNQTFSGANSLLNLALGSNDIVFYVFNKGSNEDDFEITNFSLTYDDTGAPVPLPSTLFLLGAGIIGLAGLKRRHVPRDPSS